MHPFHAKIARFLLEPDGETSIWIASDKKLEAKPGQYVQAILPGERDQVLPITLYLGEASGHEARLFGAIPAAWSPGTALELYGPLGRGFHIPPGARRLALLSFNRHLSYLLPLISTLSEAADVSVFTESSLAFLPPSIEIYPLEAASEAFTWADFIAIETSAASLPLLAQHLGVIPGTPLPCPAQALVNIEMPCRSLAECGVCAIPTRSGKPRLACVDGPVFDLAEVLA